MCSIYSYLHALLSTSFLCIFLRDLFWEQHHRVVAMDLYSEAGDSQIPEYPLPEQIEGFIQAGKYKKVETLVTRANYQRRIHNLLYLEEFKQREDMSRWVWPCIAHSV